MSVFFLLFFFFFRERVEKEKAVALQRELERAAREKERRELEEKKKALEKILVRNLIFEPKYCLFLVKVYQVGNITSG